jgi:hypothetical protein
VLTKIRKFLHNKFFDTHCGCLADQPKPTGRDNADHFINKVQASNDNIIIMYGTSWPWMANGLWRDHVITKLQTLLLFRSMGFQPPDELDDWTFTAYRMGNISPIARRGLDDPA